MGQGPAYILAGGAVERLRSAGHQVESIRVESATPYPTEIATGFEIAGALAKQVRMATRQRRFPIVIAGNCLASVGAIAGLPAGRHGLVWLDAHADFRTPETTRSGFLDGMALAVIAGHCWTGLAARIPRFEAVATEDILLIGTREVDEAEVARLGQYRLSLLDPKGAPADLARLSTEVERLQRTTVCTHLHIDLDVLSSDTVAPANHLAPPGGLALDELIEILSIIRSRCRIGSATLASYDPSCDPAGRMREGALRLLEVIADG